MWRNYDTEMYCDIKQITTISCMNSTHYCQYPKEKGDECIIYIQLGDGSDVKHHINTVHLDRVQTLKSIVQLAVAMQMEIQLLEVQIMEEVQPIYQMMITVMILNLTQ